MAYFTRAIGAIVFTFAALNTFAQPATPLIPHVEAVGSHDINYDSIGATPGDFRVDEGGAASYTLPILSLPGTAGLSPKLSLDYSARGSVGAMGTGWTLTGQSAFSRCKKTVEAGDGPGPHAGVDFADTANVVTCMDGQRIFSVSDTCPALVGIAFAGRPFRTELDPSTRICGYSAVSASAEIDFWLVFPKDGTLRRYGYAGASALRPNNGATGAALTSSYQVQALDRIADATGNTVDFSYVANIATGELLLSEARYTGKVANRLNMAAGYTRQPSARTAMVYEAMPLEGQRVDYFGGAKMALTQRLSEINVYGPANNGSSPNSEVQARRYRLSYAQAFTGSRIPRLISVQECAPGASAASDVCYPPTRFAWNSSDDNDFPEGYLAPGGSLSYSNLLNFAPDFKVGDVDGDGRQDVVFLKDRNCSGNPSGEFILNVSDPARFRYMVALGNSTTLKTPVQADVFSRRQPPDASDGGVWAIPSCTTGNPGSLFKKTGGVTAADRPVRWDLNWFLFDMTGDGRDDLIVQQQKTLAGNLPGYGWFVHNAVAGAAAGSWTFSSVATDLNVDASFDQDANFVDVTGDGLPDLLIGFSVLPLVRDTAANNLAYRFGALRFLNTAGFDPLAGVYFGPKFDSSARTGDLNGDGIADLLLFACVDPVVANRNGKPTNPFRNTSSADFGDYSTLAGDANNPDGVNDTPCRQAGTRTYWVAATIEAPLSGDLTLRASQCVGGGSLPTGCTNTRSTYNSASFVDLNGDSYADIWINKKASGGTTNDPNDQYSYRLNRGGNTQNIQLLNEVAIGLTLRRRFASKLNLADLNGDKRLDVLYQDDANIPAFGTYPVRAKLQNASGFSDFFPLSGAITTFGNLNPDAYISLSMDLDGDGAAELMRYKYDGSSSQNLVVAKALPRYGGNDFIVKFTNGFNVEHTVSYAPLVSKFTYQRSYDGPRKDYGRGSVVFDVFTPLWAVREAKSSSPGCAPDALSCLTSSTSLAATSFVRYTYQGARVQTGGRGFLGFAAIRTEDIQNKLLTTTEYRQDFPFIGRASHTIVQKLSAIIPDTICLANPLDESCFEEPPDTCGPGICPIVDPAALLRTTTNSPYRFMALTDPVVSDLSSSYTSTPVFVASIQQAIVPYANATEEKRFDFATGAQTQRVTGLIIMDTQGNLFVQESSTFDAANVETERKGQINFYGCTETPVILVKGQGCQSTPSASPERIRLGRLSLATVYSVRGGNVINRRSSFEYDPTTLLLVAEVSGLYNYGNPGEPPAADQAKLHQRTDYALDANGNRTLSVTCNVSNYPNRAACTNLSGFLQQQWPATASRFQRYTKMQYDALGRFMQGSQSPYYSAGNLAGVEAFNERSGVDQFGTLHRTVYGDPLGAMTAHGVFAEKFYGPLGREYFARAATGAFSRSTYAWCSDATSTTLPDGSGGIPASAPRVNCPLGALYRVESNTSEDNQNAQFIAPRGFAYFDKLGRSIAAISRVYQSTEADPSAVSRWAASYTKYDLLGRVKAKSEPYFSTDPLTAQSFSVRAGDSQTGIPPAETRSNYDALGRSASVELPSESYNGLSLSSAEFDRMQTKSFNPRSNASTMDKNGLAEALKATDANAFAVDYGYESFGNLSTVKRTPTDGSNANTQLVTELSYDILGRKSAMTDPDKGTLTYQYNALGELLTQIDAKGQTQSLFYDALGRLIERRETRNVGTSFIAEPTAKWIYDDALLVGTTQKAVGLLINENNGLGGVNQFVRGYSYDQYGRSAALATILSGVTYYQRTTYDQYGRVFQSFDASTDAGSAAGQLQIYSADGFPIAVREAADGLVGQIYNEVLSLSPRMQVRRERYHGSNNLVSNRTFEENTGRLAMITTGINGSLQKWNFGWDKNGSLSERADTTNGADWKEAFTYDSLDRLINVKQVRSNGVTSNLDTLTLGYDQLGNITSKSGTGTANLGSYLYKSFEAGCANQAGPHAASLVNGKSYCYDVNGNNTEVRKNGSVIRTIVYTGFDLAESIVRDEMTPEGRIQAQVSFKYGTDRAMFKRVDGGTGGSGSNCTSPDGMFCARFEDSDTPITPGIASKTTYYVGNVEFIREGMVDKAKRYIGNYLVITNVGNNAPTFDYLLRDSLGSIDTIASETGAMKSRQSFNAHGQRRTAAASVAGSWNVLNPLQISLFDTSTTTQGYTGHEQLDAVGLVHMGARLYDPELGRFIQADDFVEPDATQGLNRYSYVLNNPLSATDPTGNFSFRQALGVVVGVVAAIFTAGLGVTWAGFFVAVGGGFASAVIATGSLKAGLWGAVSAAAFWGIGSAFKGLADASKFAKADQIGRTVHSGLTSGQVVAKIAAHAGAGGTLNLLQGGKFGHGFVAAGFTEALSPAVGQLGDGKDFGTVLARTAASAAIGGTASVLSGGSFANGARTAAFQQLFNHVVSEMREKYEQAREQAQEDGEKLLQLHIKKYDTSDPNYHRYSIGPTLLCSTATEWCTFDFAAGIVGNESVPFTFSYSGEGQYNLPLGTGSDPIDHTHPAPGVWINSTKLGHRYHPGDVYHGLYKSGGQLWLYTIGAGTGANPAANMSDGNWIFANMHSRVVQTVLTSH